MTNIGLINLNSGELSPMLDTRADLEKYISGCRVCENFLPRIYGPVERRPGTIFIHKAKAYDT